MIVSFLNNMHLTTTSIGNNLSCRVLVIAESLRKLEITSK